MNDVLKDNKDFVEEFKYFGSENVNLDQLTNKFSNVDKALIKTAEKIQSGKADIEDLDNALNNASTTGDKFASSLKSAAANIGIMLAVNIAVKAASAMWDEMNVTVAETQEKIDGINASLTTLNDEYSTLASRDIDSLSQSEKDRMQYLEDRIAREERLLAIEEAKRDQELVGHGFTDYFDEDNYYKQWFDRQTGPNMLSNIINWFKGGSSDSTKGLKINTDRSINSYKNALDMIDKLKASQNKENLSAYEYIQSQDSISQYENTRDNQISRMEEQLLSWEAILEKDESVIEELNRIISNPNNSSSTRDNAKNTKSLYETEIEDAKEAIDMLRAILKTPQNALDSLDERLNNISAKELKENFTEEEIQLLSEQPIDSDAAIEDLQNLLRELQGTADDAAVKIRTDVEVLSGVESLSRGMEQLSKIYADVLDKGDFDWSSILNNEAFASTFGSMEQVSEEFQNSYENFIETIAGSPDDIDACQRAFDDLATAYIQNSGALDDLNDSTKTAAIAMLEQMGIANAAEIVEARLAQINAEVAAEEYALANIGKTLESVTYADVVALNLEAGAANEAEQYLANLALAKIDLINNPINSDADIANIIAIANAAGTSAEYVSALQQALINLQNAQNAKATADANVKKPTIINGAFSGFGTAIASQISAQAAEMNLQKAQASVTDILSQIQHSNLNASDFYARTNYSGGSSSSSGKTNKSAPETSNEIKAAPKTYNWIETALNRLKEAYERLHKAASSVYRSFTRRNTALSQEVSHIRQQIDQNRKAYNAYMDAANAVGLSDHYKNLIQNGTMSLEDISDETLQSQIDLYQDYYEKATACSDAVTELNDSLMELAREKFDLIAGDFESRLELIRQEADLIDHDISRTEAQGYLVSERYYEMLTKIENQNLQQLKQERSALQNALQHAANSGIEQDSEAFRDLQKSILEVDQAIKESNESLVEFSNHIRELSWERFDYLLDTISRITDESDFLIELLENSRELLDDAGNFNSYGKAALGLHGMNYNTYMNQADKYAQELKQIKQAIAGDPYNTELINRKYELIEAQREAIQSAEQEKQAMVDLVKDGIEIQLNALQELIDKRKEALHAEKDLYDYQKSITEQTRTIASLEKQMSAYEGDTSEEARAKIQELKVSLEEAKNDLKETEYEKYISDQERMLDDLYTQYEEILNMRLDNIDALMDGLISQINSSSSEIAATIAEAANSVGLTITDEMNSIWNNGNTGLTNVIAMYGDNFTGKLTTLNDTVNRISDFIQQMLHKSNEEADKNIADNNSSVGSVANVTPTPPPPASPPASSPPEDTPDSGTGGFFIHKKDYYPKSDLHVNTSIVDRLKYHDYDSSMEVRRSYYYAMGGSGTYTGTASQNKFMLKWMKENGYRTGTRYASHGLHLMDEDGLGSEFLITSDGVLKQFDGGEHVFNSKMVDNLWSMASGTLLPDIRLPEYTINQTAGSNNGSYKIDIGDINMYGVNDPVTFSRQLKKSLQNDHAIKHVIQDITLGEALGRNSLTKYSR